jgi:type IV secretory pathway component VirB8
MMQSATSNALALIRWHDFRFFQDFGSRDFAWLLIGVLLTLATVAIISRRRRRWF